MRRILTLIAATLIAAESPLPAQSIHEGGDPSARVIPAGGASTMPGAPAPGRSPWNADAPLALRVVPSPVFRADAAPPARVFAVTAPYESDILTARPVRWHFGLVPGIEFFQHLGSFSPACDCTFEGAKGSRFMMGAEGSVYFPKVGLGARLHVTWLGADADFSWRIKRSAKIVGEESTVLLDFENTSHVQVSWVSITPALTWAIPYSPVFFYGGLAIGVPLTTRYDHVETVLDAGYAYYDLEPTNTLLAESDIPGGDALRFALAAGVGIDIPVAGSFSLAPRAGIEYPLTAVSSSDESWRIMSEYVAVALRWRIK